MHDGSIAVLGDKDSVLAFKAIGLDVFPLKTRRRQEKNCTLLQENIP